ncbi:tetratricopeptide repeat protein [Myxococcus sp. MISCRS1]|uniref:HEAT repeat domain-containing protein n=1 Tax=Myxococcus sp. MISCRS1 TaxID=2996786 RepID=UPI00226E07B6|nr:tetratricopeptide repeat protein [Myxococcus sp. MISCRS1]MCY0999931.1 tetratricopeptide repeat protein [Myxococcus sp. MISCRS1]
MRPARPVLLVLVFLALLGTAAGITLALRSPGTPPPAPAPRAATPTATPTPAPAVQASATPTAVKDAHPARGVYAGSEACGECHEDEHAAWGKDWHARALSPGTREFVVGDYAKRTHFKGDSSEAWMRRDGERHFMRTKGSDGQLAEFPVEWVIGGKRMQDPVAVMPDGRWQVLPVYYHVTGKGEWVDYSETKQGALTPEHPFFWTNFRRSAQHACLDCHVTGLDARYDREKHTWTTAFTDAGVACESCHGPGARHADTQEPKDIVQPSKLSNDLGFAVCAQCHGPRRPLFPILDTTHRYQPGQRYEDFYQPIVVFLGNERSGDYFTDGRPSTSSFEYQALIQSACHLKGGATCLTCHTAPHEPNAPNELNLPDKSQTKVSVGSATCQQCHADLFARAAQHARHTSRDAQDCLACHMPPVVSGVLDKFADHALDVPAPQNTTRHAIPNACNTCHTKQTPEAMAQAMTKLWPAAAKRQERRLRLADAFDDKTAQTGRPALEATLADANEAPSLRGAAAKVLVRRYKREAIPALRAALKSTQDSQLRTDVIEALSLVNAREASEDLAALLQTESLWVRQAAAVTLASFGDARGLSAVEALASKPETSGLVQPHLLLAQLAVRRKDLTTAVREFEKALDLQPYNPDALIRLADVYVVQGQVEKGRERLEEALRFDPQSRAAKQRLSMLQQGR